MSELGRLLREAREAKKLSLADVESVTRIRQKYLEALENGEFASLPQGAVARGLLRIYAAYLGLDSATALALYKKESGDTGDDVEIAEPGKPRLVDYRPLEVELSDSAPRFTWWPWAVAVLLVAAAAAIIWWWLNAGAIQNPLAAFRPTPSPTATATATPPPTVRQVTATPRPTDTPPLPTPTSDLLPLPTPTVPPSPTPTPRPTLEPEVAPARIALELRATQRTWLRVIADGITVEEGLLEAGATRAWEANESIIVRTGNAGGVTLILNGEDLGVMGNIGQVVERTWVVQEGEITEAVSAPSPQPPPTATPTPAG